MKQLLGLILLVGAAVVVGWYGAKCTTDAIPRDLVHNKLREAGDSAVTAFVNSDSLARFVAAALADTVEHYEAEVRAATRIVVERDTIRQTDTVTIVEVIERRGDTVTVPLPLVERDGVTVGDTLELAPEPEHLARRIGVVFEPDTLIAALLRTQDGIDRFSAGLVRSGASVRVVDAAQLRERRSGAGSKLVGVGTAVVCLVAGWSAAEGQVGVGLGTGTACGLGLAWQGLRR